MFKGKKGELFSSRLSFQSQMGKLIKDTGMY